MSIRNPRTGRQVRIGTPTYKKLVRDGVIVPDEEQIPLPTRRPVKGRGLNLTPQTHTQEHDVENGPDYLSDMPNEIIYEILIKLDPDEVINYCKTSKKAEPFFRDKKFWINKLDYDFDFISSDGLPLSSNVDLYTDESGYSIYKRFAEMIKIIISAEGDNEILTPHLVRIMKRDKFDLIKLFLDITNFDVNTDFMSRYGSNINYTPELIDLLVSDNIYFDRAFVKSIKNNFTSLDAVIRYIQIGSNDTYTILKLTSRSMEMNRSDIVDYIFQQFPEFKPDSQMDRFHRKTYEKSLDWAVKRGYIDSLRYMSEYNFYPLSIAYVHAAQSKKIKVLEWLDAQELPPFRKWGNWNPESGEGWIDDRGFGFRATPQKDEMYQWFKIANEWKTKKWQSPSGLEILQWMVDHGMELPETSIEDINDDDTQPSIADADGLPEDYDELSFDDEFFDEPIAFDGSR